MEVVAKTNRNEAGESDLNVIPSPYANSTLPKTFHLALDILDVLSLIRESSENGEEEFDLQYEVFFDEKQIDDDAVGEKQKDTVVDIYSHKAIFDAIYQNVSQLILRSTCTCFYQLSVPQTLGRPCTVDYLAP